MVSLELRPHVAEGVHRCGSRRVNWYLIEAADGVTIVDSGFPSHYDHLVTSLDTLGYAASDVAACILTHAHPDHIGFAQRLVSEVEIPVWIHEEGVRRARAGGDPPLGGLVKNLWRPAVFNYFIEVVRSNGLSIEAVESVQTFSDGETVDVPGRPRVIHVPGHTEGEVAFHLADRDVLVCGDAVATVDFETWQGHKPQLLPKWLNGDHRKAKESLDRLESLGEVALLPGHGDPWFGDMSDAIEAGHE